MEVANTLAYFEIAAITARKSFIVQSPDVKVTYIIFFIVDVSENISWSVCPF